MLAGVRKRLVCWPGEPAGYPDWSAQPADNKHGAQVGATCSVHSVHCTVHTAGLLSLLDILIGLPSLQTTNMELR